MAVKINNKLKSVDNFGNDPFIKDNIAKVKNSANIVNDVASQFLKYSSDEQLFSENNLSVKIIKR